MSGDSYAIPALVRKRAELAGDIETTHRRLKEMIVKLEKLDSTIRLFDPTIKVASIKPKAFRSSADWSQRGEMSRVVLDILRQAAEPLTTRDIPFLLLIERALDENDKQLLRLMTKLVGLALRHKRDDGLVESEQGPGQYMLWKLTIGSTGG
jgi:hypothetical protein